MAVLLDCRAVVAFYSKSGTEVSDSQKKANGEDYGENGKAYKV